MSAWPNHARAEAARGDDGIDAELGRLRAFRDFAARWVQEVVDEKTTAIDAVAEIGNHPELKGGGHV